MTPTHVPRGFMCIGCEHIHRKCNHLDFTKMQVIGIFKDDGVKEVKCTDYVEKEKQITQKYQKRYTELHTA